MYFFETYRHRGKNISYFLQGHPCGAIRTTQFDNVLDVLVSSTSEECSVCKAHIILILFAVERFRNTEKQASEHQGNTAQIQH
jgi:hypothetical protein